MSKRRGKVKVYSSEGGYTAIELEALVPETTKLVKAENERSLESIAECQESNNE